MDNIAGSPVEGDNFFGRKREIAALLEWLHHHDILLLGPRRIGKTSVCRRLMRLTEDQGWQALEINVASCADEREFLHKLETELKKNFGPAHKLWDSIQSRFSALGGRIKTLKMPIPGAGSLGIELHASSESWTTVGSEILTLIVELENRWLIYIDELPILLYNIISSDAESGLQRVRRFLDWFRNDVRGLPGTTQIRWLVSGSVGLDTLVQQHKMADTINTLKPSDLPPFTQAEATDLLFALAERYQLALGAEDIAALLTSIGWLQPYYIQRAFSELRSLIAAYPELPINTLIERAVDELANPAKDNDFHFWHDRLSIQLSASDARHAATLLTVSSARPQGIEAERLLAALQEKLPNATTDEARDLFLRLREILVRDAYWIADASSGRQCYRFALEPLRRWWHRRNEL